MQPFRLWRHSGRYRARLQPIREAAAETPAGGAQQGEAYFNEQHTPR